MKHSEEENGKENRKRKRGMKIVRTKGKGGDRKEANREGRKEEDKKTDKGKRERGEKME